MVHNWHLYIHSHSTDIKVTRRKFVPNAAGCRTVVENQYLVKIRYVRIAIRRCTLALRVFAHQCHTLQQYIIIKNTYNRNENLHLFLKSVKNDYNWQRNKFFTKYFFIILFCFISDFGTGSYLNHLI